VAGRRAPPEKKDKRRQQRAEEVGVSLAPPLPPSQCNKKLFTSTTFDWAASKTRPAAAYGFAPKEDTGLYPDTARWMVLSRATQSTVPSATGSDVASYAADASASHQKEPMRSHAYALIWRLWSSHLPGVPVGTASCRVRVGRGPRRQPSATRMADTMAAVVAASLSAVGWVSA